MGELDEAPNTDAQHDPEEPKETDKMLEKKDDTTTTSATTGTTTEVPKQPSKLSEELISKTVPIKPEKKKEANGEEIINIPETEADPAMNPVTEEGREVKPKKIPIGGIKMPGFFTKIKPRGEGDGADGELLEREGDDNKANENEEKPKKDEKKPGIGERIRNFFSKKKKDEPKSTEAPMDNEEPPPKKGLLNAIKLPIANMIPKKKTEDDVELGTGPGTKAGLASMETLDDSLKDQDTVDKVPKANGDDLEKIKSEEMKMGEKPLAGKEDETYDSCMERLRHYKCSLDDALIVLGLILFFILVGIIIAVLTWENAATAPIREGRFIDAQTSCGMVEGLKEDGGFVFRGIPYAVPPIGENRWKPAKLIDNIVNCWNGTLKAHNETEVCAQILANGTKVGVEDCLTLDVVTPYVRYENPLPVIVMIGAESLTGGSPSALRPSSKIAKLKEVVFVRPNFRMGVLGFLALEALSKSTRPPTSGNYGLSDIIAVLKWVELNIAHFGGDKNSVILVGHRAGATLVSALVTSREVKKLYSRAWVTSSATIFPGRPLSDSERRNHEYLDLISCNDTDCLRNESTDDVLNATPDTWRHYPADLPTIEENTTAKHEWLVLDGQILQQNPADVWKNEIESLKIVIGSTAHGSHSEKLHLKYTEWTPDIIQKYVEDSKIGSLGVTENVLRKYNATYQGLVSMISDIRTICPLLTIAQTQYNNNIPQPAVPFYIVTHPDSTTGLADADIDVKAIFGHYDAHTQEQKKFVSTIQKLFFRYVTHGEVAQFDSRRRVININQDAVSLEDYPNCNFWISNDVVPRYSRVD